MPASSSNPFSKLISCLLLGAVGVLTMPANADTKAPYPDALPSKDLRAVVRDLDTHRVFSAPKTLAEWKARRAQIRQRVLVSCGLYPLPPKTPLKTKIFDRVEREGYSIEKVYFQTYPGFYLAGNLYRPLNASGKIPGVLVAHGHWSNGRMANQSEGSISARAITFARQGYVAFTYDMVGYNDTRQITHKFANSKAHWLYGVSLMGLQTWNSIRALDFLCSLPQVDQKRLAITGESGGGTQTMMLGAIDDRLAATAPCVMVSHTMQGGCLCENAPGLRIDYFNVEVAGAVAPKPQIIVGASGDWTTTTLTMEGPSLASVYKLYDKPQNEAHVLFNYGHNINQTSREAVYAFFGKHLLGEKDTSRLKEPPYTMEPVESLRVFPDNTPLPSDAKNEVELTGYLQRLGGENLLKYLPQSPSGLSTFRKVYAPLWEKTLDVEMPQASRLRVAVKNVASFGGGDRLEANLGRAERGDNLPISLFTPTEANRNGKAIVLAHPQGRKAFLNAKGEPNALVNALTAQGYSVLLLDAFLTGENEDATLAKARKDVPFNLYFSSYNRTDLQERVQDLITATAYLRHRQKVKSVTICGRGEAGVWALLAAPAADAVAADTAQTLLNDDVTMQKDAFFVPGLRRMGDFHTALTLAAPNPVLLYNLAPNDTLRNQFLDAIAETFRKVEAGEAFTVEPNDLTEERLIAWLTQH